MKGSKHQFTTSNISLTLSQERDYRRRVENYTTIFEPLDQSEMVAERSYSYFKCDHSRHHFVVSVKYRSLFFCANMNIF